MREGSMERSCEPMNKNRIEGVAGFSPSSRSLAASSLNSFVSRLRLRPGSTSSIALHIRPTVQIFWASRASWSCEGEDAPRFDELPEWWRK